MTTKQNNAMSPDSHSDELLYAKKSDVIETFLSTEEILRIDPTNYAALLLKSKLYFLFGDKCLPDKELEHRLEQPSVQVEPKFKVGDKVRVLTDIWNQVHRVNEVNAIYPQFTYKLSCSPDTWFAESVLEHYTEPKFKVGDKVVVVENGTDTFYDGMVMTIREVRNRHGYVFYRVNGYPPLFAEKFLEPYTEPETKDNMEEKELNLCELLKGCEEEEFYCPYLRNNVKFIGFDEHDGMTFILSLYKDGLGYENLMYIKKNDKIGKSFVLYPSRALYEKYPLDAYSAWMEWKESRKPKRWRAQQYENYWYLDRYFIPKECTADANSEFDNTNYENGNYFRTKEEARQAAEAVRKCLEKFHKDHAEH